MLSDSSGLYIVLACYMLSVVWFRDRVLHTSLFIFIAKFLVLNVSAL